MTDPNPGSNRALSAAPGPASPAVSSTRMPPPRQRPQPTPTVSESGTPARQRSTSAASASSSRQVRRQPSRESASPSSQQTQVAPAQRPTSSSSMHPPSLQTGRPPFAPLYTVVTNATSDTAHHPRVHYIFSDDDENEALSQALNHAAHRQQQYHHHNRAQPGGGTGGGSLRPPFPGPSPSSRSASGSEDSLAHGNRDRAVLLDLAPSADGGGWEVAHASSLSADWAVVSAQVSRLQDGDGGGGGQDDDGTWQSLMLKIEGVDGACGQSRRGSLGEGGALEGSRGSAGRASSTQAPPEYDAILEEFERKMGVLRQVVEAGDEKRRAEGVGRAELGVVEEESAEGER